MLLITLNNFFMLVALEVVFERNTLDIDSFAPPKFPKSEHDRL